MCLRSYPGRELLFPAAKLGNQVYKMLCNIVQNKQLAIILYLGSVVAQGPEDIPVNINSFEDCIALLASLVRSLSLPSLSKHKNKSFHSGGVDQMGRALR